jgi:UDP-N-acetylmuramyl pentapeptide phosphotransferase/UDP-N-acetylglucosamine-1-phosphate transferase
MEKISIAEIYSIDLYHFDMYLFASLIVPFFIAFFASITATHFLLRSRVSQLVLDRPNHRSLHSINTPRTGGLAIAISLLLCSMYQLFMMPNAWEIVGPTFFVYAMLLAVSLFDDVRPLSPKFRLVVHFTLAMLWVAGQPLGSWLLAAVFALGITWAMNLYNFMDGADGLAGGVTLTSFIAYALVALSLNQPSIALLSISVCGSALGFLLFNWPPAKVFLGDAGSIPLGFLAAAVGTTGVVGGYWGPTFPLMLFAMFWVDATYTLTRRALRREKVWQAHNEHWYQKAIRAGNSHRKILLIHLVCNTTIATLALLSTLSPTFATPLVHHLTIVTVLAIAFGFGVWAESQFRGFQAEQIK